MNLQHYSESCLETTLSGWGRYPVVKSYLQRPEKVSSFRKILEECGKNPVIARGLGRSYGDAALNAKGNTVAGQNLGEVYIRQPNKTDLTARSKKAIIIPNPFF